MAARNNYVFVLLLYVEVRIHGMTQDENMLPFQMKTGKSGHACPREPQCTCYSETTHMPSTRVDCSNRNFSTVPQRLPTNANYIDLSNNKIEQLGQLLFAKYPMLQVLNMSSNDISFIGNHSFGDLKSVTHLDLQYCNISHVEAGAFKNLTNLTYLDMSENTNLTFRNLRNISYGLTFTTIKELRLNSIHTVHGPCNTITKHQLEFLGQTNVTDLYLDSNRIATFSVDAVKCIPRTLEILSMKANIFMFDEYIDTMYFNFPAPKLKKLIISFQGLSHFFDQFHSWVKSISTNDISFQMDALMKNNHLSFDRKVKPFHGAADRRSEEYELSRTNISIHVPENLSYADASNSNFKQSVYSTSLVTPNNLTHLLMNNNILWQVIGPLNGFDNLTFFDLSCNYCQNISQFALENMANLQHLNLSTNFLGFALENDENGNTFQNQFKLRNLDLTNNKIRVLPLDLFHGLINLQSLNLSHNMLLEFHVRFDHMKKLEYLSLRDNMLATIPKAARDNFDRLAPLTKLALNLEANHFKLSCNATHQDFLRWMIHTRVRLSKVTCFFDNGSSVVLSDRNQMSNIYDKLLEECSSYLVLLVVSLSLTLLVIFITVTAVVYRFRWNLRYMYYMTKFKFKGYIPLANERHRYEYDVFVSYADEDRGFVRNEIVEKLENDNKMTLLVHDRDFIAGEFVGDNIIKAVTNSRKTLIVLSKDFLKSQWCMYELNMARMEAISRGESVICVIKKENIPTKMMPLEVLNVMQHQTYIDYPQEEEFIQAFWDRLVASLSEFN